MAHFCIDRKHTGDCYWLARMDGNRIETVDGCHSSPEGVAKAAKLYHRIFGAEDDWFVVKVESIPPWADAPINEQAAADCAQMIASTEQQNTGGDA